MIRQSKINLLKEKYGNMIDDEVVRNSLSNGLYLEMNVGPTPGQREGISGVHSLWMAAQDQSYWNCES